MTTPKSLGQVLFEASPNVRWEGAWEHLGDAQRQWWEAFAEVAKSYMQMQSPGKSESSDTIFDMLEQSSSNSRGSETP